MITGTTLCLRIILFIRKIRVQTKRCGKIDTSQYPTASSLSCWDTNSIELGHGFGHGAPCTLQVAGGSVRIPEQDGMIAVRSAARAVVLDKVRCARRCEGYAYS